MARFRPTRRRPSSTPGTNDADDPMNNKSWSAGPGARVFKVMTRSNFRAAVVAAMLVFTATGVVGAQNKGQRITPNFRDVEIGQVIEAVAQVTGKTIIPDPRVRAQVTM